MKIFFKNLSINIILLALVAYFALASQPYVFLNITSKVFPLDLATKTSYIVPFLMEFAATIILIKALRCFAEGSWRVSIFIFVGYFVISWFNYISSQYGVLDKVKKTVVITDDKVLDNNADSLEKKFQAKINAEALDYQPKSTQNLERQINDLLSEKDAINKETSMRNCPSCVLFHRQQMAKHKVLDDKLTRLEKTLFGIEQQNKIIAENWQARKKQLNADYNTNIKKIEDKHKNTIAKDYENLAEQSQNSKSAHGVLYFVLFMLGATKALVEDNILTAKIELQMSKTKPLKMLKGASQMLLPAPKKVKANAGKPSNFKDDYLELVKNNYLFLGDKNATVAETLLEGRDLIATFKKDSLIREVSNFKKIALKDDKIIKIVKDDFEPQDLLKIEKLMQEQKDITQIMAEFPSYQGTTLEILEEVFKANTKIV